MAYVSYRIGDRVFWTRKPVRIPAGETLLTDGETEIRARCGNAVSDLAREPVSDVEPMAAELDEPISADSSLSGERELVGTAPPGSPYMPFLLPAQGAFAQGFNPYSSFTDSGPVTPEEKARREQLRTDLYDRLSPDYRLDGPLVSEASIAAVELAIQRYREIAASGGWPLVPQKVTLRPGDTSSEIATIRQHLIIEGDLPPGGCMVCAASIIRRVSSWACSE